MSPASTSPANSCETAGPETPVRLASSEPDTDSVAIARIARYCGTVSEGWWRASRRSIQRDASGATAASASAASAVLRGGGEIDKLP